MLIAQPIVEGLAIFAGWSIIFLSIAGVLIGLVAGAIPGITGSIAIAVVLPMTFWWQPLEGLAMMLGIFTGSLFGGSVPAILINAPGTPASAATPIDGYPMAQKGEAARALGIALTASCTGCLIGLILLMAVIEPLGRFALMFGPWEMLLVAILGLTVVASLGADSLLKGALAALLGLLLGTVGSGVTGARRATFGLQELEFGLPTIPVLIGLLAFSELFYLIRKDSVSKHGAVSVPPVLEIYALGFKEIFYHPVAFIRSSIIGIVVGTVPAAGSTIASVLSYNYAVSSAKDKQGFGEGRVEGLLSAEAANSSSEAGSLATLLALGIPGGAATAVLAGAFLMYGLPLGPRLVSAETALVYGMLWVEIFQVIVLLLCGGFFVQIASKLVYIRTYLVVPAVFVLVLIGPFVTRDMLFDGYIVVFFGVLGWLLKQNGYPVLGVLLGIILAPMVDEELVRIGILYDYNPLTLLSRPVALILVSLIVISLISSLKRRRRKVDHQTQ